MSAAPEPAPVGDGRECRVCREGEAPDMPLFYPCRCSGSIKYIHQECLESWLAVSRKTSCELCKMEFHFAKRYKPGTPRRLSVWQLVGGASRRAAVTLNRVAWVCTVLFMWAFVVPVLSYWMHTLAFCRGLDDARSLLLSLDLSVGTLAGHCAYGMAICSAMLIGLGVLSFLQDVAENMVRELAGGHFRPAGAGLGAGGVAAAAGGGGGGNQPAIVNQPLLPPQLNDQDWGVDVGNDSDSDDGDADLGEGPHPVVADGGEAEVGVGAPPHPVVADGGEAEVGVGAPPHPVAGAAGPVRAAVGGAGGNDPGGLPVPADIPLVAEQEPQQLARLLGLRGNLSHLLHSVVGALALIGGCIALWEFMPYRIGLSGVYIVGSELLAPDPAAASPLSHLPPPPQDWRVEFVGSTLVLNDTHTVTFPPPAAGSQEIANVVVIGVPSDVSANWTVEIAHGGRIVPYALDGQAQHGGFQPDVAQLAHMRAVRLPPGPARDQPPAVSVWEDGVNASAVLHRTCSLPLRQLAPGVRAIDAPSVDMETRIVALALQRLREAAERVVLRLSDRLRVMSLPVDDVPPAATAEPSSQTASSSAPPPARNQAATPPPPPRADLMSDRTSVRHVQELLVAVSTGVQHGLYQPAGAVLHLSGKFQVPSALVVRVCVLLLGYFVMGTAVGFVAVCIACVAAAIEAYHSLLHLASSGWVAVCALWSGSAVSAASPQSAAATPALSAAASPADGNTPPPALHLPAPGSPLAAVGQGVRGDAPPLAPVHGRVAGGDDSDDGGGGDGGGDHADGLAVEPAADAPQPVPLAADGLAPPVAVVPVPAGPPLRHPLRRVLLRAATWMWNLTLGCSKVVFISLGVRSTLCVLLGVVVDLSTLDLLGAEASARVAFFRREPLRCILLHYFAGVVFSSLMTPLLGFLRRVIHPDALVDFLPVEDNGDQEQGRHRMLRDFRDRVLDMVRRSVGLHVTMAVLSAVCVAVPAAILARSTSQLPLRLAYRPTTRILSLNVTFFHVLLPFTLKHFPLRRVAGGLATAFMGWAAGCLGAGHMLATPPTTPPHRVVAAVPRPLRAGLFVCVTSGSLAVVLAALLSLQLVLGRAVASVCPVPADAISDVYSLLLGFYSFWALVTLASRMHALLQHRRQVVAVVCTVVRRTAVAVQWLVLCALWFGLLPAVLGIVLCALAAPQRLFSEWFHADWVTYQWGLGLPLLQAVARCVALGLLGNDELRRNMERLRRDGYVGLRLWWAIRAVVWPYLRLGLTVLCPPHAFARGVLPLLGASPWAQLTALRVGFRVWVAVLLIAVLAKVACRWVVAFHDSVLDELFLVGQELRNVSSSELAPAKVSPGDTSAGAGAGAGAGAKDVGDGTPGSVSASDVGASRAGLSPSPPQDDGRRVVAVPQRPTL